MCIRDRGDSTPLAIQSSSSRPQYCSEDNLVLTALNGNPGSYEWRIDSLQSGVLSTASTFSPTVSGTYYLTGTIGCGSEQTVSREIVFANLTEPTEPNIIEDCGVTTITRADPPAGEVWHWQTTIDGTDLSSVSTQKTRTFSAEQPLFLRSRVDLTDCWGPARAVNFQVRTAPQAPELSSLTQTVRCSADSYDIFATIGDDADTVHWYDAPTGGNFLDEGLFYLSLIHISEPTRPY